VNLLHALSLVVAPLGAMALLYVLPWGLAKPLVASAVTSVWIALAALGGIAGLVLFAARWRVLTPAPLRPGWKVYLEIVAAVATTHNLAPFLGAAGTTAGLALLVQRARLAPARAAVVIALDSVFVGSVRMVVLITALACAASLPSALSGLPWGTIVTGAAVAAALPALVYATRKRLPPRFAGWLRQGQEAWSTFLSSLRDRPLACRIIALEGCSKLLEFGAILAIQAALGLPLRPELAVMIMAATYIATNIAVLPGSLGFFEASVVTVYMSVGVPFDAALTAALILHAIVLGPLLVVPFALFAHEAIGAAAIRRFEARMRDSGV
jgi:uncharacterized membrane protein YbhN (UPF0104 family)